MICTSIHICYLTKAKILKIHGIQILQLQCSPFPWVFYFHSYIIYKCSIFHWISWYMIQIDIKYVSWRSWYYNNNMNITHSTSFYYLYQSYILKKLFNNYCENFSVLFRSFLETHSPFWASWEIKCSKYYFFPLGFQSN